MNPFEELIQQLSSVMDVSLHPDSHESCLISFPKDDVTVQIDLDTNADQILIGSQLGRIVPGIYRERILMQALKVNGTSHTVRGILAFSEKNDTLVLFQFLPISSLTGELLYPFLILFKEHAKSWKQALNSGDIPQIQEDVRTTDNRMFGLMP